MTSIPRSVSEKILKRCERGDVAVVVPKKRRPSRVFGLDEYLKIKRLASNVKPWTYRKKLSRTFTDPLQAVDGRVLSSLRRQDLYE
ncbi:MAG: hypothetical protein HY716_11075 [Planctomycetes bacterium]|nr:hypothetical protein [Planctomycetota bacterium]